MLRLFLLGMKCEWQQVVLGTVGTTHSMANAIPAYACGGEWQIRNRDLKCTGASGAPMCDLRWPRATDSIWGLELRFLFSAVTNYLLLTSVSETRLDVFRSLFCDYKSSSDCFYIGMWNLGLIHVSRPWPLRWLQNQLSAVLFELRLVLLCWFWLICFLDDGA